MLQSTGNGDYVKEIIRKYPKIAEREGGYVVERGYGVIRRTGDGEEIAGFAVTEQEAEALARGYMEVETAAKEEVRANQKKKLRDAASA